MSKNLKNAVITSLALTLAAPAFAHTRNAFVSDNDKVPAPVASQIDAKRIRVNAMGTTYEITAQCDKGSVLIVSQPKQTFGSEPDPKVTGISFDLETGDVMATASNYGEVEVSKDLKLGDICEGPNARDAQTLMKALRGKLTFTFK